jgi:hypothetical protein
MEPVRFETTAAEYSRAFRSARTAKNLLVLFILLALLVQIAAVVLVHFVGVLNPAAEAATPSSAAIWPTTQPSAATHAASRLSDEQAGILSAAFHSGQGDVPELFAGTRPAGQPYVSEHTPIVRDATTAPAAATAPAIQPAAGTAAEPSKKPFLSIGASGWQVIISWGMSVSKFVAMTFGFMLVFTLLLTMDLSLLGRLGGVAGFVSAFFWSLLLLAMLIPWHEAIHMSLACGAMHNLGELQSDIQSLQSVGTKVFSWPLAAFYCRFLAYPGIALMVLLLVQAKFAKGYGQMTTSTTTA